MDYPKSDPSARLHNDKFTDGDPVNGILASRDSAEYQNMVFDELINVIVGAGLTPDESVRTQLLQAIQLGGNPARTFGANDYAELPGGLILQWGTSATQNGIGTWTFPIPFPNSCLIVFAGEDSSNAYYGVGANPSSNANRTTAAISSEYTSSPDGMYVMAIGY